MCNWKRFCILVLLMRDMKNETIELESVGALVVEGIVYPQLQAGGYDTECGVPLEEVSEEWLDTLSDSDLYLLMENGLYGFLK